MPFMDMWANINPPGTNVRPHNHYSPNHPNSLVGVYYLRKPTNSGNLIIEGEMIDIQEDDIIFLLLILFLTCLANIGVEKRLSTGISKKP